MAGKHRVVRESLRERFSEQLWRRYRIDFDEVWQGIAATLGVVLVMAVAVYLLAISSWA